MKCCYFCNKPEKIVLQKRTLWNGKLEAQCVWCFKSLEDGLKIAKERGFYDEKQLQLSISKKPTTSSGEVGDGRYRNMKVSKDAVGGDFLKAGYVKEHKIQELLIIGDAQITTFESKDGKKTEKLQFKIQYEGYQENKEMPDTWTMNSKSKNAIINAWGDDTDNWKGKPIPITLSGDGDYLHIKVDELRIK